MSMILGGDKAEPVGDVGQKLGDLQRSVADLSGVVSELKSKLRSAMSNDVDPREEANESEAKCDLSSWIQEIDRYVNAEVRNIRDILYRIQL